MSHAAILRFKHVGFPMGTKYSPLSSSPSLDGEVELKKRPRTLRNLDCARIMLKRVYSFRVQQKRIILATTGQK